jgi:hypothetical protein
MASLPFILLCCAVIVLAAVGPKPVAWAALAIAVVALFVGFGLGVGR